MQIFLYIIILYINELVCLSVMLLAKLKYFFGCLILFLWAMELHKNIQEGGDIKSKDIWRGRPEQLQGLWVSKRKFVFGGDPLLYL